MIPQNIAAPVEKVMPAVELSSTTEENYYEIARVMMKWAHWILDVIGQGHNTKLFIVVYAILVFLLSLAVGLIVTWVVVGISRAVSKKFDGDLYRALRTNKFFSKSSRIVTPLVFIILIQFTLYYRQSLALWLTRLTWIYVVVVVAIALSALVNAIWERIDLHENKKHLPLKGLVQLVKGVLWIISGIVIMAILFNKSPGSLLAGLGAFAAVLMLVFKDSILGVVAGVQLSENDSLHVGDWIKVNGTDANGTVMEVTLTTVKIQNWDKTITTVPPYQLISGSFTNYRNMSQSNTRRIQRSYMIDADSVRPADDAMLDAYAQIPLLKDWIAKKRAQKAAGKIENVNNSEGLVDGSIETNLGVFRAYLKLYLNASEYVAHDDSDGCSFCFVTTLPQTSAGIPLQIYCFTSTSAWLKYEAIQASIFEHVAAMLPEFNLLTFENPSGRDTVIEGAKDQSAVIGLPFPYFKENEK